MSAANESSKRGSYRMLRCHVCEQDSVRYFPGLDTLGDIIQCENTACGTNYQLSGIENKVKIIQI